MAEQILNTEDIYNSIDIESDVKSKALLDFHMDSVNEYKGHIEKSITKFKSLLANFNEIKNRITSNDLFLTQLEEIELERQALIKKRNNYFLSKKFIEPDQLTLIQDSEIRQHFNKDENYEYIGSVLNQVFNLARLKGNARYAEALLRQSNVCINSIPLSIDQVELLKDITFNGVDPHYWPMLDDLDTIEEQLTLNRQTTSDTLSGLLEKLL